MGNLPCPAPSLQSHYKTFITNTSGPAPVPRGTLPLTIVAACGPPSRSQRADLTHFDWPSVSRRQVLLFPTCACDELTPPIHRTPPGPHAGSSPAEGTPTTAAFLCPGTCDPPSFGVIVEPFDASAVVYAYSSSRRLPDPLIAGRFRSRFPPRLLTDMTLRWFGISACTATPEDLPPSQIEHVSFWRSSTSSSLHFQDTHRIGLLPQVRASNRTLGYGCRIRAGGSHRAVRRLILCQVRRCRWLRQRSARSQ